MPFEEQSLKSRVAKGAAWVSLEQICVQGLNFALGIVLARLLTPTDYGTVAVLTIFVAVAQVLVISGLGQALVQKRDVDALDFTSVFYVSLSVALFLYAVLFWSAPLVAQFYKDPALKWLLRVLSLNLIFYAVNSVQGAELFKNMRFDISFRISLVVTLTSAAVGVTAALCGLGAWALVLSSVLSSLSGVVARSFFVSWRPTLDFSLDRIRPLFAFGWKMMVSALLSAGLQNLYGVLIGRYYSRADLAFVNKGRNLPDLAKNNVNTALVDASFPALARMQAEKPRLLEALRRLMSVNIFVIFPIMAFMAMTARDSIMFLYGEQWLPCAVYMQLTCVGAIFASLGGINQQSATALGRSDVVLKLVIFKSIVQLVVLLSCLRFGVLVWFIACTALCGPLNLVVDIWVGRRMVNYGYAQQLKDVLPPVLLFGMASLPALAFNLLPFGISPLGLLVKLACQFAVTFVLYSGMSIAFRIRAAREVAILLKNRLYGRVRVLDTVFDHVIRK